MTFSSSSFHSFLLLLSSESSFIVYEVVWGERTKNWERERNKMYFSSSSNFLKNLGRSIKNLCSYNHNSKIKDALSILSKNIFMNTQNSYNFMPKRKWAMPFVLEARPFITTLDKNFRGGVWIPIKDHKKFRWIFILKDRENRGKNSEMYWNCWILLVN